MAIDTIKATAILDGAVDTADLADGAVTTAKITDGEVTSAKIGDGEVTSAKLDTNIDVAGTLDVTGATTLDAGLTVDTDTLVVDETNNRVGIGTDSPISALHVEGDGGAGSTIRNVASSGSCWFLGSNTSSYILHNISNTPMVFTTNGTAQMRLQSSGDLQFNSGYGSVATAYGCRAWVNFNGTGTVAIRESGNVSSITDNNTGSYTVNFTTAMPDINFCVNHCARVDGISNKTYTQFSGNLSSSSLVNLLCRRLDNNDAQDPDMFHVAVFR